MDSLIGLIIFGVIAGLSGLVKLIEKRKEEELRRTRAERRNVDDLPEATRRMLYGEGGPPVARRRGEGVPPPPVAVPRRPVPPPTPPQRPLPMPRGEMPAPPVGQRRPVPQQRPAVPQRQAGPPPMPQQRPQPQQIPRTAIPPVSTDWTPPPPTAAPRPEPRRAPASVPETSASAPATEPARRGGRRRQTSIKELVHYPATLRTSIVLMEVLGTPRGLRE